MAIQFPISVSKTLWRRRADEKWAISDAKALVLSSENNAEDRFFVLRGEIQMMTSSPNSNLLDALSMVGPADFLMQQSIVPVVAWIEGGGRVRCIGTASIISCSGYALTAAHVLLDPYESGYGTTLINGKLSLKEELNFGVLIPFWAPGVGMTFHKAFRFYPFEKMWIWGQWRESPLVHEPDRFETITDIALCKIPEAPSGMAHQPLNMSLNSFSPGEDAYAIGYAEMPDIELDAQTGRIADRRFRADLYVSVGSVINTFPNNHIDRAATTPGPCFDFSARIPGKMSGSPVFGARGIVVRGVVSRSFSGEEHAFGSMLDPIMDLALNEGEAAGPSLRQLMENGNEGMTKVVGRGL